MDALSKWRQSTLEHRNHGTVSRSPSPAASAKSDGEEPLSSGDEGAKDVPQVQNARTTSVSWIRWWNRSQRNRASSEQRATETRPALFGRSSEPVDTKQVESYHLTDPSIHPDRYADLDNKRFRRSVADGLCCFCSCFLPRYLRPRSDGTTGKGAL